MSFNVNYIEKGGKGLKNASFWAINSKKIAGGSSKTCLLGEKNESQKRGGGNDQNAQYISMESQQQ